MSQIVRHNQASGAYQPWQLRQFDVPAVVQTAEAAEQQAEPPAGEPEPEPASFEIAPGVQLPTAEDVERIVQEAWKEGYAAGYEEGSARGRIEAAQLHQLAQSLDEALTRFDEEVAEDIQMLAIEIARQVVRDTLAVKDDKILAVVREALLNLPQQSATIRVNPGDAQVVRRYLAEQYDGIGHRIAEDESVAEGGCLIESTGAQIDAQIQTRWRRVVENLTKSAAEYLDE